MENEILAVMVGNNTALDGDSVAIDLAKIDGNPLASLFARRLQTSSTTVVMTFESGVSSGVDILPEEFRTVVASAFNMEALTKALQQACTDRCALSKFGDFAVTIIETEGSNPLTQVSICHCVNVRCRRESSLTPFDHVATLVSHFGSQLFSHSLYKY